MTLSAWTLLAALAFCIASASPREAAAGKGAALPAPPLSMEDLAPAYKTAGARAAAERASEGDWVGAREALLGLAADGRLPEQPERLRFLLGLACLKTGDMIGAEAVLDRLDADLPLLADRVLWIRGTALAGLGRSAEAAEAFARVPDASLLAIQARDARAEALLTAGRASDAAEVLRKAAAAIGDSGIAGRLASALQAAGDKAGAERVLREAFDRASSSGRRALRSALENLGAAVPPPTADADALETARDLLEAQRSDEAVKAAGALLDSADPQVRCEARRIRAGALTKLRRHAEALVDYRGALSTCEGATDMARLLFNAVRSAYRAGEMAEGDHYAERLAGEFPSATFNDDVAVMRARQAIGRGDQKAAEAILQASILAWPNGDMANESRWLMAWAAWTGGDRALAAQRCRDGRKAAGDDADYGSRFAYWEARALQKAGRRKDAEAAFESTARAYPMTFYAVLALDRLAALRKSTPEAVLKEATAGATPPGPFFTPSSPKALEEGPAARILWLARTGLPDLARDEAIASADRDADAGWLAAMMLDAAGVYTRSHRAAATLLKTMGAFWPDARTAGYQRLAWPRPFKDIVERAARESAVDPMLIWAVMRQESAFVTGIESHANAIGLMQLILPTARSMAKALHVEATPDTLRRPEINVRLGAAYLSRLVKDLHEPLLAIPGYNAGGGAVERKLAEMPGVPLDELVESIGATETRDYARRVYENWAAYRWLYAGGKDRLPRVKFERGKGADAGPKASSKTAASRPASKGARPAKATKPPAPSKSANPAKPLKPRAPATPARGTRGH